MIYYSVALLCGQGHHKSVNIGTEKQKQLFLICWERYYGLSEGQTQLDFSETSSQGKCLKMTIAHKA